MKKATLRVLAVFFCIIFFSGCSWIRAQDPPMYSTSKTLPLKVGVVIVKGGVATAGYSQQIVKKLVDTKVFKTLVYPYNESEPVDGVLQVNVQGGWEGSGVWTGIPIGLTLGLLGTVLGPSIDGRHTATVTLAKGSETIAQYSVTAESSVTFGLYADTGEVNNKADTLQQTRLAVAIAKKFNDDYENILHKFGK